MQFSNRFLNLVQHELNGFDSIAELENLVIYVAHTRNEGTPSLEVVGQMPRNSSKAFPPIENDPDLQLPSPDRRWYPLQDGSVLLGVIRAERFSSEDQWPEELDQKLQSSSLVLSNCLSLELDRARILDELSHQKEQIRMLVHQLRNPLTALRTYAQLLLRKVDPEGTQRDLVEGLLSEQAQFNKYLLALDQLSQVQISNKVISSSRLLMPPLLPQAKTLDLLALLAPLIDRAAVTARLQKRQWHDPGEMPDWIKVPRPASEGVIVEIVANLLENAFRYSPVGASIGLLFLEDGLCVWDSGDPIDFEDREKIFLAGFRSKKVAESKGSGLGLMLGRKFAEQLGGTLELNLKPQELDYSLPAEGNAFVLRIPLI